MSARLTAANANELVDLADWLEDHPAETDEGLRWKVQDWLIELVENTSAYPSFIAVPTEYVEVLDEVIDDWVEILTAHDEPFLTALQVNDAAYV